MQDKINEFKKWLEEHAKSNKLKAQSQNECSTTATFHLGGSLAFEKSLDEFNKIFDETKQ